MQYFLLSDITLHLLRKGHHPAANVVLVGTKGVYATCQPNCFHRTTLRFATSVAAKHPSVALEALVEGHLLGMYLAFVVPRKGRVFATFLLALNIVESLNDLLHEVFPC